MRDVESTDALGSKARARVKRPRPATTHWVQSTTPPQVQAVKIRRREERSETVSSLFKGAEAELAVLAVLAVKEFPAVTAVAAVTADSADSAEISVSVAS